jgi:hypothetical protein
MTLITPGEHLSAEAAAELALKYGCGACRALPPLRALRACAPRPPARRAHAPPPPRAAVERFLSSVGDYQDAIPGLLPRPGCGGGGGGTPDGRGAPDDADADARAALLRALAAAPAAAPPPADGWALLARIQAQRLLPTGCDAIDELLHGGGGGGRGFGGLG